ncbi:MAG: hypothetical protein RLZZ352_1456 [Pseudomonadota bacterium]|jgi:O-antigen/teichoic acid export membrane protein
MKKNYLLTATSIAARLSTSFILFVVLARHWGPVEYGAFVYVFSLCALLVLFVEFGLQGYLLREIAFRPKDTNDIISCAFWVKILFIIPYLCASFIVFIFFMGDASFTLFLALSMATLILSFADFFVAPLRPLGRYDLETYIVIGTNLLILTVLTLAVLQGYSSVTIAWLMAALRLLQWFIAYGVIKKIMPALSLVYPGYQNIQQAVQKSMPYGIDGFITTAWIQIDIIMAKHLFGSHTVGLYSAGQRIVQAASAIAPVIGNVMVPKLAGIQASDQSEWKKNARQCIMTMGAVGVVMGLPLILFQDFLVLLLFGSSYQELAGLFPFLGILVIVRFLASAAGILLTGAGMQASRIGTQLVSLVFFGIGSFVILTLGLSIQYFVSCIIFCFLYIGGSYLWKLKKSHHSVF